MHSELIRRSLIWLSNIATGKGIRGCPEITLCEGYVADAGAIMNLQRAWGNRFFKNTEPSIVSDDFTFIVEAKASRSDYMKTFKHGKHFGDRMQPMANFHFIVVASGVLPSYLSYDVAKEEIPSFWGCLEESRNGLRLIKVPEYCHNPSISLHEFGYRILRYADPRKYMIIDLKEEIQIDQAL